MTKEIIKTSDLLYEKYERERLERYINVKNSKCVSKIASIYKGLLTKKRNRKTYKTVDVKVTFLQKWKLTHRQRPYNEI